MTPPLEGCFPPQQDPVPGIEQVGLKCLQQGPVFTPLKPRLLRPLSIPEQPSLWSRLLQLQRHPHLSRVFRPDRPPLLLSHQPSLPLPQLPPVLYPQRAIERRPPQLPFLHPQQPPQRLPRPVQVRPRAAS